VDRLAWHSDATELVAKVIKCTHCGPGGEPGQGEIEVSLAKFREDFENKIYTIVESATDVQDKGILQMVGRATDQVGWREETAKARVLVALSVAAHLGKPLCTAAFPFTLHTKPKRKVLVFVLVPQGSAGDHSLPSAFFWRGSNLISVENGKITSSLTP
jgi:hypothetical protein